MNDRRRLKVAFVSDVTCPWCAIGLAGLERAIDGLRPELDVEVSIEPFELNPGLPAGGQDVVEYAASKYGATPAEFAERQALIRARAAAAGLQFAPRTRVWNTFDAHRLLHWAGLHGRALELKRALLDAYHVRAENPGALDVLLRVAGSVGLDVERARSVLAGSEFAAEVRARMRQWHACGISAVPAVVVDDRWLIPGGQPADAYERALREAASAPGAATAA
jgi:predicted DsbA family dithiol-disulfide isomerase